jgi:isopentenyl-diphosphate Delta-isomerase
MNELIYYVDKYDVPTGEVEEKHSAHNSSTKIHAAFSCYIFNDKGMLLVTRRADSKKVWPGVWTNSCCGHPMPDESRVDAIKRRVKFELGAEVTDIKLIVPEYSYIAPPYHGIVENEYCPVYTAKIVSDIKPNPDEVSDYKWVSWQWFLDQTSKDSDDYSNPDLPDAPVWSWWCKDQIKHIVSKPV